MHHKIYQRIPVLMIEDIFNQFSFWRTTIACQSRWTKIMFLSYNAKLSHLHQDNLTHRKKYITGVIRKTLDNITQDDITKVCQEVLKPVAELTHKTKDQGCFSNNIYGKMKLVKNYSYQVYLIWIIHTECIWFDIWCCTTKLFTFHTSNSKGWRRI